MMEKIEMQICKVSSLPQHAVQITSRPGMPAFDFMARHRVELYIPNNGRDVYYMILNRTIYRIKFAGVPSRLVQDSDFLHWFNISRNLQTGRRKRQ